MSDERETISALVDGLEADATYDVYLIVPPEGEDAPVKLELEYRGTMAEYERRRRRLIWVWDWLRWRMGRCEI